MGIKVLGGRDGTVVQFSKKQMSAINRLIRADRLPVGVQVNWQAYQIRLATSEQARQVLACIKQEERKRGAEAQQKREFSRRKTAKRHELVRQKKNARQRWRLGIGREGIGESEISQRRKGATSYG